MGVQKTDISLYAKVKSLGASFFQRYTTTKDMNKKITEMNNIGLRDLIIATAVSQTTDFGSLKVGDLVVIIKPAAGEAEYKSISTAGDLGVAAVPGQLYIVLTPSM
tara:strand:- start:11612 stop:11929 length:318 start_codon:yes stop_codon:yes gene_type:complete